MAEKKTEKKTTAKKAVAKAPKKTEVKKNPNAKRAEAKKRPEAKAEDVKKPELETNEEKIPEKKEKQKKDHRVVWAVILTFLFSAMLFGMAFFIFMNLEVIADDGLVRIEHGKIYVDNRKRKCTGSDVKDEEEDVVEEIEEQESSSKDDKRSSSSTESGELVENPNARVVAKGAQLVEVGDFEFYLPKDFEAARGNGNGRFVYNLMDNDGWADVKVYAEKTTAELMSYMQKKDSLLRLTDATYYMNGTSWVEMQSGSSVAYGTRLGDTVYMVVLNIKLESDATDEASQMIPKTIRLKKVYK